MIITQGTLDLNSFDLTLPDELTVDANGTLQLQGGEIITTTTTTLNAGSTVLYDGAGAYTGLTVGNTYSNLIFNGSGSWTLDNALDVNADLILTNGTLDVDNVGNYQINVAGDWGNNATLTARNGAVVLDGTAQAVNGSTTFYNLTKSVTAADTLTFEAGQTQTIASGGTLNFSGTPSNVLQLRSDTPSSEWFLTVNAGVAPIANYVDVRDSNAASGQTVNAYYSTDAPPGGSNTNWVFGQQLQLVKQVWDASGSSCLASIPADGACNGGTTLANVPTSSTVQFLVFVRNVMAVAAGNVRFQDLLDDAAFTYQAGTLKRTPADAGAPSDSAAASAIFAAASTAQTDAFDGDIGIDEFAGVDTTVSPDNLLVGGGGAGQNDTLTIPAHKTFAIRFEAVKN